jgi:hypothetical protein
VRHLALTLLLAAPLAAGAQYPAPYPYPPPPPPPRYVPYGRPPPAPPSVAPALLPLSPVYFNLGLGYGFESWYSSPGYEGAGGFAYHVEGGVRLMPQLLLGFDLSGVSTSGSAPTGWTEGITVVNYDAVLTLFPFVQGFFLRGGAGVSTLTSVPTSSVGTSDVGTNLLLGAGWAFPVAPPLHITLGADWSHQYFGSADATGFSVWMMRIGFGMY